MEIEIRKMELTDLEAIEPKLESDFDDFWSVTIFRQELINENSYYLVAIVDGEIVGFAGYMLIFDEADITNIVVRKDMRNMGIATKLLEDLLATLEPKDATINLLENNKKAVTDTLPKHFEKIETVTLEVNENNTPAITLYEKFGFNKVGLRKNYYDNHENALIMTKRII